MPMMSTPAPPPSLSEFFRDTKDVGVVGGGGECTESQWIVMSRVMRRSFPLLLLLLLPPPHSTIGYLDLNVCAAPSRQHQTGRKEVEPRDGRDGGRPKNRYLAMIQAMKGISLERTSDTRATISARRSLRPSLRRIAFHFTDGRGRLSRLTFSLHFLDHRPARRSGGRPE